MKHKTLSFTILLSFFVASTHTASGVGTYTIEKDFSSCDKIIEIQNQNLEVQAGTFIDEHDISYTDSVYTFKELEIIHGYDDGSFGPKRLLSRTEFLKMLFNSHCIKYRENSSKTIFGDVSVGDWKSKVVNKASETGIANGEKVSYDIGLISQDIYPGTDSPGTQELKNIFRFLGMYQGNDGTYYGEGLTESIINFQLKHGIIYSQDMIGAGNWGPATKRKFFQIYGSSGDVSLFRPNEAITNMEALKLILNISGMSSDTSYNVPSAGEYNDWQLSYMNTAYNAGILQEDTDPFIHPNHFMEREFAVELIHRTIKSYK